MKAGLIWPMGRVHISNKSTTVFQECCFFTSIFLAIQNNILVFSGKRWKSILYYSAHILHFWKGRSMSGTYSGTYMVQKYWLFQQACCSFERRVGHLEMHTALLQRVWSNCSRNIVVLFGYVPFKTRCIAQGKIILILKGLFVLKTPFLGRY